MTAAVPPPSGVDWRRWADDLRRYLQRTRSQLEFLTDASTAAANGVLLWDEENGYPVVSADGGFQQVVLANGYAQFYQDNDVTAAASDTAYAITFDAAALSSNITRDGSKIVFANAGLYKISFSAQVYSTTASSIDFRFWPALNGTDIAKSCRLHTLHANAQAAVVSSSAIFNMSADDYLEAKWSVSDHTNGSLKAIAATAYAPASPAVAMNILRVHA